MARDATTKPLPASELRTLAIAAKGGCRRSRDRVIAAQMRWIERQAFALSKRTKSLTVEDLVNEGVLGAMHALDLWDPERGVSLFTYSVHWIRAYQDRQIKDTDQLVRHPCNAHIHRSKIQREVARHVAATGEEPTDEHLATLTDLRPARVAHVRAMGSARTASLNDPLGDASEGETKMAAVPDEDAVSPLEAAESRQLHSLALELLDRLPAEDRELLVARASGATLEEVGDRYGITKEAVRQRQLKAEARLREVAAVYVEDLEHTSGSYDAAC